MLKKLTIIVSLLISIITIKAQQYSEYEVKLVYLYQSLKYVNWPSNETFNSEHFIIGIYGPESIYNLADKMLASRKVINKPCKIIQVTDISTAKQCDAIYIINFQKFEMIQILNALNKLPILTIGDQLEEFCNNGGMINFTDKTEKLRLELCPDNFIKNKLQVSKQLYAISKVIESNEVVF